jgi:PLP dependent protein
MGRRKAFAPACAARLARTRTRNGGPGQSVRQGRHGAEDAMTPVEDSGAVAHLAAVRAAIGRAAQEAGRAAQDVTLVYVSKTFGAEEVAPVLAAGQRVFGENRVQEAAGKWPGLRERFEGVELHLIGPLQTNKVREAVALFDVIETLDRESLAQALVKERDRAGRLPRLLVQVNTGEEPQKAGVLPEEVDAFLARCRDEWALPVEGLMCIPPAAEPPSPHFALLVTMARRHGLRTLSMGMSADFEEAIQLGATHVRVGSAIFGSRG